MKKSRILLFVLFAIVSIAVPLGIIYKYQNTLKNGTLYKFRTEPIDPYDPFRGRYVTLAFEDDFVKQDDSARKNRTGVGLSYVKLKVDAEGYAVPVERSLEPFSSGDFITVESSYWSEGGWRLSFPFNRYYLPEKFAPLAEQLYRDANPWRSSGEREKKKESTAYVTVRVLNGAGVIEELFINGKPVLEAVRDALKKQEESAKTTKR